MRVGILVFDDVEVLDACGPFEVFSTASRVAVRRDRATAPPFEVVLVAADATRPVRARGGLRLLPDHGLEDAPALDVLLVPGGVTAEVEKDPRVVAWIASRAGTPWVASVCTGAFLLAEAGLLVDQRVTTHWDDVAELAERFPALDVVDGPRWVRAGQVFTSAGISAGLDLALELVSLITDEEIATDTARLMDYAWNREPVAE
ncbi:DJ-1/PfpI family protein [Nocardioides pacificus]